MVFIFMIKTYTEVLMYCVSQQLTVFTVIIEICIIHRSRTMTVLLLTTLCILIVMRHIK